MVNNPLPPHPRQQPQTHPLVVSQTPFAHPLLCFRPCPPSLLLCLLCQILSHRPRCLGVRGRCLARQRWRACRCSLWRRVGGAALTVCSCVSVCTCYVCMYVCMMHVCVYVCVYLGVCMIVSASNTNPCHINFCCAFQWHVHST
jgi:hypothetical protein